MTDERHKAGQVFPFDVFRQLLMHSLKPRLRKPRVAHVKYLAIIVCVTSRETPFSHAAKRVARNERLRFPAAEPHFSGEQAGLVVLLLEPD
jgi:hypothetical protein